MNSKKVYYYKILHKIITIKDNYGLILNNFKFKKMNGIKMNSKTSI